MASVAPKEQTDELLSRKEDHSLHNNVATPYKWPVISSDRQAQPIPNGRIHNDSEAEGLSFIFCRLYFIQFPLSLQM